MRTFLMVSMLALAACSTTVESRGTSSGSGGATSTSSATSGAGGNGTGASSSTSSSGVGGGGYVDCPSSEPAAGSACASAGEQCAYGDDPRAQCRDLFTCEGGAWQKTPAAPEQTCTPASACPGEKPAPQAACTDAELGEACAFADGSQCLCAYCGLGGPACMPTEPPHWGCTPAPSDPHCPTIIPNAGTACTDAAASCPYPGGCGVMATCKGGVWTWTQSPCPE
ncbi:MAG TPA: hypothetical protein VHB21_01050 [Minicystis sp.]|nr:hypothetical protein [Minicystis sp.]